MPLKQETRSMAISTPLGADVLALRSLSVQEQLTRLFQIEVELTSENGEIDFDQVVGHPAAIELQVGRDGVRHFHGQVSRFVQLANQGRLARYRATLVPWLWLLTRTSDCRIFQGETTPAIIEKVFQGHGFSDYELKLSANYPEWEYCVQYRETDFNFVSRLVEQAGIYYFFRHEAGKHTLVLADDSAGQSAAFPGYAEVPFQELQKGSTDREVITDWVLEKEAQPVAYALNDYDFTKPKASLRAAYNTNRPHGEARFEIYDYPGEYVTSGDGDHLAQVRLEELQAQYAVVRGQASARGLAPGSVFKLQDHPRPDQNGEYLITGVTLHADAGEFDTAGTEGGGEFFTCQFTAIDSKQPFRPPRLTPKPVVQGPQTAVVAGPASGEIHTDEYGRVKVQFHWDRHGQSNQDSSCWIRVAQVWAGKEWGSMHIPRIGQEVIVEFLEGDPDRPIITGRVYNADQMPPYKLPANKTQSGIKSRSSEKGKSSNFNEIRFEDKKDSEELYIHAEKDKRVIVENDRSEDVGHNESITIGNDRGETVGNNENITIGNDRTESVANNENVTIDGNRSKAVGDNEDISVGENQTIAVGKDQSLTIGQHSKESVTKDRTTSIGGSRQESVGKDHKTEVGKKYGLIVGDEIVLKAGEASLTMKKDGTIELKGKDITIKGSGKITAKADGNMILKGSKIAAN